MSERDTTAVDITQPTPTAAQAPASPIDFDRLSEAETMAFVEAFLNRLSPAGLSAVIRKAQDTQKAKQQEAKEALLAEFRERAASLGLRVSLEPLETPAPTRQRHSEPQSTPRPPVPVKYRGPQGETWTGRGHTPGWLTALEAVGHTREQFRVKENSP